MNVNFQLSVTLLEDKKEEVRKGLERKIGEFLLSLHGIQAVDVKEIPEAPLKQPAAGR